MKNLKIIKEILLLLTEKYKIDKSGVRRKWYKYTCNKCGWTDGWIEECGVLNGNGCSCCNNLTTVQGINDIPTTDDWMVKYFQGGYNEAKLYCKGSHLSITPICPDCGRIKMKKIKIQDIYQSHSINCSCSDNISFPEKFMFSVLEQLGVDFQTQISKTDFEWCNKYYYDFYISSLNCIIETHGNQHYKDNAFKISLQEQQEIDMQKEQLAKDNGIVNYIQLDCRKSEIDWIKSSILNSKLNELFDFSKIDWMKCYEYAVSNLVKKVCDFKNSNPNLSPKEISKFFKLNGATIRNYLKQGNELGWCNYDAKEEIKKYNIDKSIKVYCIELDRVFNSMMEVKKELNINNSDVSSCCMKREGRNSAGKHPITGEPLHWRYYNEQKYS